MALLSFVSVSWPAIRRILWLSNVCCHVALSSFYRGRFMPYLPYYLPSTYLLLEGNRTKREGATLVPSLLDNRTKREGATLVPALSGDSPNREGMMGRSFLFNPVI